MQYIVFLACLIFTPLLLCLIDRRVKGARSVLIKLLSVIVVTSFILLGVYFWGSQILSTFRINMKSMTSMKAFFSSRMLMYFIVLILVLFVACKFVFIRLTLNSTFRPITRSEKAFTLATVFFDLALVPNILVNSTLFGVFGLLAIVEIGLVYAKLVFSITNSNGEEVLA